MECLLTRNVCSISFHELTCLFVQQVMAELLVNRKFVAFV
jgi:hypothetical protein